MKDIRHVVLLGAGHAHMLFARRATLFARHGATLTLVSPGQFWYSGLAPGVLGGQFEPELDRLDPAALAEAGGARYVRDQAVRIDTRARQVELESGDRLPYDLLSLNIGSRVRLDGIEGAAEHGWPVKPVSNLIRLRAWLDKRWNEGVELRLAVAGGGATGCEVAANLADLARRRGRRARISLLVAGTQLLASRPAVGRCLETALRRRGIEILYHHEVAAVEPDAVVLTGGQRLRADAAVIATGLVPPPLARDSGLPVGPTGGLAVSATLDSVADLNIFGVGDCIDFMPRPLPRLGLFGVRQAPVLLANLVGALDGLSLLPYHPQRLCLSILNLGRDEGLGMWGPLHWRGRPMLWLKNRMDLAFLARVRRGL